MTNAWIAIDIREGFTVHKRAETEAKLVEAARRVIIESGFEGCTLERICSAAGFTRGAFYSNFSDKEALFTLLVKDEYEQIIERTTSVTTECIPQLEGQGVDPKNLSDEQQKAQIAVFLDNARLKVGMDRKFLILHNELLARAAREPEWAMQFMEVNREFVLGIGAMLERMLKTVGRTPTKRCEPLAQAVIGIAMRYTGVSVWKDYLSDTDPTYKRRGTMLELEDILDLIVTLLFAFSRPDD